MPRKKLEVVELNKKEEKILLEETSSPLVLFFRNHRLLIFLTLFIISLTTIITGVLISLKNVRYSGEQVIKEASIDTTLDNYKTTVTIGNTSLTEDTAKDTFNRNNTFKSNGEVLLNETIEKDEYTIKYYSDGTALKILKNGTSVTRISPLSNGKYGINKDGVINSSATISDITISKTKDYSWGKVTYFSDGSAQITNSIIDMFVRNANDIKDNYISDNKVTYLSKTKKVGNVTLNYYYDGTIEIIKNNKSYLVRTEDDLNITGSDVTFKNNNQAEIISIKKFDDGRVINYYEDGGAIIKDGNNTLSVRKSNSIIIKNNKIFEIVDSIYVEVSKKNDNTTYYTNGSAVTSYNGNTYYIEENSNIKYQDNTITSIGDKKELLSKETNLYGENVKTFEKIDVITTKDYIAIIPSDKVIYDEKGKIKELPFVELENENTSFEIMNNTNEKVKYRVIIEESPRTDLKVEYIRYIYSINGIISNPARLDKNVWHDDNITKTLNIKGTNYILIENTIEPQNVDSISIMLWTDYDTIPNAMQNKYFYGTIRLYAWIEE